MVLIGFLIILTVVVIAYGRVNRTALRGKTVDGYVYFDVSGAAGGDPGCGHHGGHDAGGHGGDCGGGH